jgi:superfamily II DNA or RNA helicase
MTFAVGALVRTRGREWVVLPESEDDFLVLRPLGGTDDEVTGIHLGLETVGPASFDLPTENDLGDFRSARMLRDAVRLGFRNSAGPFRSFGRIACEPRPYQLVPLLMAMRQHPVRLLIADDVGIGKTIEACLIARELLDRGEVRRLAVLCPPHLAEQWKLELSTKFNLNAELVLAGTAARLERECGANQSLFEVFPHVIVSTDYIKSDRRREDFLRAAPELVIVDEAHTCAESGFVRGPRHQRHQLIRGLSNNPKRHLILVTATPHSGKEDAFRSLLVLLQRDFASLPDELAGDQNETERRRVAEHLVQRRRADIEHYLGSDTPFPKREELEDTYRLSPAYQKLFGRAIAYARELIEDKEGGTFRQRVRWWSALALLRSIASSPAAAAATLRERARGLNAASPEQADEIGRQAIMDPADDYATESVDTLPGVDTDPDMASDSPDRRKLREMARQADALKGKDDAKLQNAAKLIASLVRDGFRPIIFCRFIPTAEYVAEELRKALPKGIEVSAVTGLLPPAEREKRVLALAGSERRVLVCTDCLSEGINLQEHFDAVVHYDLSWNPTRHEQREGRVDRYGQKKPTVRVLTYYGVDNQIDGVVLDVLLRKHKAIRNSLGISVPVPVDTEQAFAAILEGALLRGKGQQLALDLALPEREKLHEDWQIAANREKLSRSLFAHHAIRTDEVVRELAAVRRAIGSASDAARFSKQAFKAHGASVSDGDPMRVNLKETPIALRDALGPAGVSETFAARFELPVGEGVIYLHRTHPILEGLATYVLDSALDSKLSPEALARRAGVVRTNSVARRTTALLLRLRFQIQDRSDGKQKSLLAEDAQLIAFTGSPAEPEWLSSEEAESLLEAQPSANLPVDQARHHWRRVLDELSPLKRHLEEIAVSRGEEILDAHKRVRQAARIKGSAVQIETKLPVDILGIYVYLPA